MEILKLKVRIKDLMDKKHLNYYSLGNLSDLSEVTIRNWYSKRDCTPTLPAIFSICKVFELSPAQLLCDETEELLPISREDKDLLAKYHLLSDIEKQAILKVMNAFIVKK